MGEFLNYAFKKFWREFKLFQLLFQISSSSSFSRSDGTVYQEVVFSRTLVKLTGDRYRTPSRISRSSSTRFAISRQEDSKESISLSNKVHSARWTESTQQKLCWWINCCKRLNWNSAVKFVCLRQVTYLFRMKHLITGCRIGRSLLFIYEKY